MDLVHKIIVLKISAYKMKMIRTKTKLLRGKDWSKVPQSKDILIVILKLFKYQELA